MSKKTYKEVVDEVTSDIETTDENKKVLETAIFLAKLRAETIEGKEPPKTGLIKKDGEWYIRSRKAPMFDEV